MQTNMLAQTETKCNIGYVPTSQELKNNELYLNYFFFPVSVEMSIIRGVLLVFTVSVSSWRPVYNWQVVDTAKLLTKGVSIISSGF